MKKLLTFGMLTFSLLLTSPEITDASNFEKIETTRELHLELKDKELVYLNDEGLITVSDKFNKLKIDDMLAEEYKEVVNTLNSNINNGIISLDKKLNVLPFEIEEVTDRVYKNDKKDVELKDNEFSTMATYLNAIHLVETNRDELVDQYNAVYSYSPRTAYSFSVGWWVGRVKEGGKWDYKSVSGFAPWYKTFSMRLYTGTEIHNSKWLGNYNYGYTGEFLFSKSILLAGGDAVSLGLNWTPDTQTVKNTISRGYNDAN
ncbi:polymorphic toxin type 44 domain-containing protein [Planomicrobium okeanokoites]|uniref:polymorphic toxin type 44 domain-containing protein n=1 Tax=Planomicrobium okeanokoites TaxID=244 RepID=UPI000A056858|nr:polymorphic toxin type 44 domain-containing protein [Planomicrobium okeanokoites]